MAASEHQQKDEDDQNEPAHHARRPMNAFLIFCKRHRASVRSGFPHLENRAVTRVLGEWWAMLNDDEKKAYTNLAQEYKDAFLNANPDFKWYKLPAPPLRTLNTRPTNKKSETIVSDNDCFNRINEDGIQPGKLADESQIGGLSSLFTPQKLDNNKIVTKETEDIPKPPKKRYLELPVSSESKSECKTDLFGNKKESNNNLDQTNIEDDNQSNASFDDNIEDNNFQRDRSCKGIRYQKFIAENSKSNNSNQLKRQINNLSSEKQNRERRNSISSNVSEKTESLSSEGTSSRGDLEHLVESAEGNLEASRPEETETEGAEDQSDYGTWISKKRFKAEDFNLEKKIEALPSLSLEDFQEKKKLQRTKKKKIIHKGNSRNSRKDDQSETSSTSNFDDEHMESDKELLVGSQKRKARKQNITRKTGNQDNASAESEKVVEESWCASPGLEALACLAAIAANCTKLTKS